MDIGNFSSYFEIFAGLNLAYISIEAVFNYAINNKILTTGDKNFFKSKFAEIVDAEIEMISLSNSTAVTREHFEEDIERILNYVQRFGVFPEGFQPAFLVSALFCIFILLSYGFNCGFSDLNFSAFFVTIINLLFLFKSFWGKFCYRYRNKLIWIPLILLGFIINVALIYLNYNACDHWPGLCFLDSRQSALLACIAGASSFIFYFIRVIFYNSRLIVLMRRLIQKISRTPAFEIFNINDRRRFYESADRQRLSKLMNYFRSTKNAYERLDRIKLSEAEEDSPVVS